MTYRKAAIVTAIIGLLTGCGVPSIDTSEWDDYWILPCGGDGTIELYQRGSRGKVIQGGIEVYTDYEVDGLTRKWLWDVRDDGYYKSIVVLQGGTARYYLYGETEKIKTQNATYTDCW